MRKLIVALMAIMPAAVYANPACPICTVAIGAALPITRRMGVPDAVAGLWVGAFLAIMGYWIIKFMDKRGWRFWGRNAIVLAASVATIGFAYIGQVKYSPCSYFGFFKIDPLLFGTVLGAVLFILTEKLYDFMKEKNGGHAHFPFEKVVLPVVVLAIASGILTICR
ncbi:MAG: hypothetical protein K2I81_02515 [Alphaproteobacteria bacterium]|nr:hypothetical protein [Alphaproteobacteria bacterium]